MNKLNRHFFPGIALVAGAALLLGTAPAMAHGSAQWSVTVETPQYYSPPVIVFPDSQFTYGAPPSAYSPPGGPFLQQPVQPQPMYRQEWPAGQFRDPRAFQDHSWRERNSRDWRHDGHDGRDRHERHDRHDRHDGHGRGDRQDGTHWGYRR